MTQAIISLILAVVLLNVVMYFRQPSMVFYPYQQLEATPQDWGLDYEDVRLLTTDGVSLHGWYIPYAGARHTLLFFHGNAGNISHRGESVAVFHRLGMNVLIIDYRGYGQSDGKPAEQGLYADALSAWRYLTDERGHNSRDIVIFGRSLGGVVAANLAAQVRAGGLLLESTFSSAADVARVIFPVLSHLIVQRFEFATAASLRSVHCPVMVLHSRDDEIIPFQLGEKVYRAANEPKQFFDLHGDHNGGFLQTQPAYEQALARFIETL